MPPARVDVFGQKRESRWPGEEKPHENCQLVVKRPKALGMRVRSGDGNPCRRPRDHRAAFDEVFSRTTDGFVEPPRLAFAERLRPGGAGMRYSGYAQFGAQDRF